MLSKYCTEDLREDVSPSTRNFFTPVFCISGWAFEEGDISWNLCVSIFWNSVMYSGHVQLFLSAWANCSFAVEIHIRLGRLVSVGEAIWSLTSNARMTFGGISAWVVSVCLAKWIIRSEKLLTCIYNGRPKEISLIPRAASVIWRVFGSSFGSINTSSLDFVVLMTRWCVFRF